MSAGTPDGPGAGTVRLLHDAYERWADMPPVMLAVSRHDAWAVMTAVQLALTHPACANGPVAGRLEAIGRHLQEKVSDTAELYTLAEAGWNPASAVGPDHDVQGEG